MTLPEMLDLLEAEGFELSLCLTLTMTRTANTDALRFSRDLAGGGGRGRRSFDRRSGTLWIALAYSCRPRNAAQIRRLSVLACHWQGPASATWRPLMSFRSGAVGATRMPV